MLYAIISAPARGGPLARLSGWHHIAEVTGILLLLLALSAAAIAVFPRLGRSSEHQGNRQHAIYFGNLRHWNSSELRDHLAGLSQNEELDALSRQLVEMARTNWTKHRWVQVSLALSLTGILIFACAAAAAL